MQKKRKGFKSIGTLLSLIGLLASLIAGLGVGIFSIVSNINNTEQAAATYRSSLEEDVMNELKNETQVAVSIIDQYYQKQQAGEMTEKQAKKAAADMVRELRYNDGNGYFWIDTVEGVNVVLLGRDTEGQSRWDATDKEGNKYIQMMIENGKQDGGGYTHLNFAKPNETEELPKINYTVLYEPYQWVLGTGVWVDQLDLAESNYRKASIGDMLRGINAQIICLLAILAVVFVLTGIIVKKTIAPIVNITNKLGDLSKGNLKEFEDQSYFENKLLVRRDEIGSISRALVRLRESLSELMKKIIESAKFIADESANLSENASQSAQASDLVANSITSVAQSCAEQNDVVGLAGDTTREFIVQMDNFSGAMKESIEQINSTNEAAVAGKVNSDDAIKQMMIIEESVSKSAEVVGGLGDKMQEIGSIVDVISNIASQTNLLSLNASIEAARAGEAGKGFAVVATEIQNLASQSDSSANEISKLIKDIQIQSEQAVSAMNAGMDNVENGTAAVESSGKAFEQIADMIRAMSDSSKEMESVLEKLGDDTQNVDGAFKQIKDQSGAISDETQTVSAVSEEQTASMQEIATASERLKKLAKELEEETSKFEID
ncbi:methyl-accepting chemotaxis sensory transducer with Cache sensor [Acetitomaculum ruminis DSM 5522]|uniref:Methyl-accepting chemotaxis sensory transducer with Cache sensor n=1 Tax=Acetitomaculum ruminis DSM 5522 TaxID=1120918 RepID=A0A1I0YX98_9FIRM|nr:methyl-accepting chemotaxis protein [Acetitomaculum ruminis]SFB17010.1 methyl-accepting chemotaxis sensory transducer with Cache sensor [Acetitomaculum ruminis DSM 5522]